MPTVGVAQLPSLRPFHTNGGCIVKRDEPCRRLPVLSDRGRDDDAREGMDDKSRLAYDPVVSRHVLIRTEDDPERVGADRAPNGSRTPRCPNQASAAHPNVGVGLGDAVVVGRIRSRCRLCRSRVGRRAWTALPRGGQERRQSGHAASNRTVTRLRGVSWGLGLDEFEQRVVHPFLLQEGVSPLPSVAEYVVSAIERDGDVDELADQLAQTLAAGEFALVVAAPRIPVGVQRVLEYLNARGQRMFGLEVGTSAGRFNASSRGSSSSP